jgi:hypothetical protein
LQTTEKLYHEEYALVPTMPSSNTAYPRMTSPNGTLVQRGRK